MTGWKKKVIGLLLCITMILSFENISVKANNSKTEIWFTDNRNAQDYTGNNWTNKIYNYLIPVQDGYMRVVLKKDGTTCIEYYNKQFEFLSQKIISKELPIQGGFYEGKNNYYLASGQDNPEESNGKEILRIVQYDKNWNFVQKASVYGANTVSPFEAGSLRMSECDGKLYVRTCHEMYTTSDGKNHQANMTFVLNENNMSITDEFYGISNISNAMAYVSHSFNQFILADDKNNIIFLDHGDAYPRSIVISKMGKRNPRRNILTFSGEIGDNFTGATVGGMEYSSSNYLVVGTYGATKTSDDNQVFLSMNDRNFQNDTQIVNLTSKKKGTIYGTPQLVKISNDKFLVLWVEDNGYTDWYERLSDGNLHYVFVDGNGRVLGNEQVAKGYLSDCQPIVVDNQIVWTVTDNKHLTFYRMTIDGKLEKNNAGFPQNVDLYPYNIKNCRLVAKKFGPIKYMKNEKTNMASFVLYKNDDKKSILKADTEFELMGCGKTKMSSMGNVWYINSLWIDGEGEKYYGSKQFSAFNAAFELPEFIHEKPQKVSVKKKSDGIHIKWQKEPYALGYYVYRQEGSGSFKKIATISDVSKSSYIDQDTKKNGKHSYYIKIYTTNGKSLITSKKSDIKNVK